MRYRRPKRLWSMRISAPGEKVISHGVWDTIIEDKAMQLAELGMLDLEDNFYMILFRMDKTSFWELYDKYGHGKACKTHA